MQRHKVESTNVAAIGYDEDTATLEVEFRPNKYGIAAVWQYHPIAIQTYVTMLEVDNSVGKLVNVIKNDPLVLTKIKVVEFSVHQEVAAS